MTDVYSHSIVGFTLRLGATKSVDHMMLLAQASPPPESSLPRHVARHPDPQVPRPAADGAGRVRSSRRGHPLHPPAQRHHRPRLHVHVGDLQSSFPPIRMLIVLSAPYTPTSKPHVERQFATVNSMFTQYLNGYLGRSPEHKGKDAPYESLSRSRRSESFSRTGSSVPGRFARTPPTVTRSEAGCCPRMRRRHEPNLVVEPLRMALNRDAYIRMLDSRSSPIQSTGIKWNNRQFDSELLHELRHQRSRHPRHNGKWEVKVNPYDPSVVWVIGRNGELIECPERGSEYRYLMPDFAPVDDAAPHAHSEGELVGTPFPTATLPHTLQRRPSTTTKDDDLPLFTDINPPGKERTCSPSPTPTSNHCPQQTRIPHQAPREPLLAPTSADIDVLSPGNGDAFDRARMDFLSAASSSPPTPSAKASCA